MKLLILVSLTVIFVASIAILLAITIDIDENNVQNISKTKITDVIPGVVLGEGSYSIITTNIADVAHKVVYTIEGEILEFGEPILHTDSQNRAHGAIPVTMSVDKLHKGTLDSDTFTFFLDSDVWLYTGEYLEGDEINVLIYIENHRKMYPGTDYTDAPKSYVIRYHSDLFEIGDKIIAHFKIAEFPPIRYIYEKDYGVLDEFYTIPLGKWGYYNVGDDGVVYGGVHHNSTVSLTRVLTESFSTEPSEILLPIMDTSNRDEPNFSVYQTTPSRYYVSDEQIFSEILEKIKLIPEGNAFLLENARIFETHSNFSSITVENDFIGLSMGGGFTGETLTIYTVSGLPVRITYSCSTDTADYLIIEDNILEVMENSSCLGKLDESTQKRLESTQKPYHAYGGLNNFIIVTFINIGIIAAFGFLIFYLIRRFVKRKKLQNGTKSN